MKSIPILSVILLILCLFPGCETPVSSPSRYSVTYDGNGSTGGSTPSDSGSYLSGGTVTVLGNTGSLVKTDYVFAGWNTQADGSGGSYSGAATLAMGTANITLYALWTLQPTFTVTYDGNGKTGGAVPSDSNNYLQAAIVTVLGNTSSLVKTGYVFAGWNTQADGSGGSYSGAATLSMGTADLTLYAVWMASYYSAATSLSDLTLSDSNGDVSMAPAFSFFFNAYSAATNSATIDVLALEFCPGQALEYSVNGSSWAPLYSAISIAGVGLDLGDNVLEVRVTSADQIAWAIYSSNIKRVPPLTITYDANGATGGIAPIDSRTYLIDTPVSVIGNAGTLVKTGSVFGGWNTKADGTGTSYSAGAGAVFLMGVSNVVLYAAWDPRVSLIYDGNGNTAGTAPVDHITYIPGSTATILGNSGNLAKPGYAFAGWNMKADGTGSVWGDGSLYQFGRSSMTLYAVWTPVYQVIYDRNGISDGSVPVDNNVYAEGASVIVLADTGSLVKTGYNLAAWNTKAGGDGINYQASASCPMGSGTLTLFAVWMPIGLDYIVGSTGIIITKGYGQSSYPPLPGGITGIADSAFSENMTLVSFEIPPGVTSIGMGVFFRCQSLTSITIPSSVSSIGASAFFDCIRLASITLPINLVSIGLMAFYGCDALTSITIPSGVTEIQGSTFLECTSLTSVGIPSSVTKIGDSAFQGCYALTSITIPSSVTFIGGRAFWKCYGLSSINIPPSVVSIGYSAFQDCTGLTSVTINEGVTRIDGSAFSGCYELTDITIPSTVRSLGSSLFSGCFFLSNIVLSPSIPPTLASGSLAFSNCASGLQIHVPSGALETYKMATGWIDYAAKIVSP